MLIVANNRSLRPHLPDLQYADDDALRYHQLWQGLLPDAQLSLLASLDATTSRANPSFTALARPPTRENVFGEAASFARAVRQARDAGRRTTFYFVFAGHGDVERGEGFLELTDSRFGAQDLERLVAQIDATDSHIIIDSCNSFFMVNPRKPGGRRWKSSFEAQTSSLTSRKQVGAFLSTSSEQTVYEWSEIQSGIFSYLVRSGLMGGADANRDGLVTYDELGAFVGVAGNGIPNPEVRPHVFARGPRGEGATVLVDLRNSQARALELPPDRRLVVRDPEGFRMAEVHTELGFSPEVRLWGPANLQVEMLLPGKTAADRPHRVVYEVPKEGPIAWERLEGRPSGNEGRGSDRLFQALFEQPFGPRALARYESEVRDTPTHFYGLSRGDVGRLQLQLRLLADSERDSRLKAALWQTLFALPLAALAFQTYEDVETRRVSGSLAAVLGAFAVANLFPSKAESAAAYGTRVSASGEDPSVWMPKLDEELDRAATWSRRERYITAAVVGGLSGLAAVGGINDAVKRGRLAEDDIFSIGTTVLIAAGSTFLLLQESTRERQIEALKADPIWQGISTTISPSPGGFGISLTARF